MSCRSQRRRSPKRASTADGFFSIDSRRYLRPFFLTPDGQSPTAYKPYYDVATWLTTQAIMSFTTVPFVVLTMPSSLLVWTRVYFYAIVVVAGSMAFFSSPGKPWLSKQLKRRQAQAQGQAGSSGSAQSQSAEQQREQQHEGKPDLHQRRPYELDGKVEPEEGEDEHRLAPMLGMPDNLERDLREAVREVRTEV